MAGAPHDPAIHIRDAAVEDIDRLVAIEDDAFATDRISRRSFRRQIASPTLALVVAVLDRTVHGYVLVAFRKGVHHARIYSLAVDRAHGRGLGRRLMAAAETLARRRGFALMRLEVNEANHRAIGIYERGGYTRIGRREDYYEDGAAALLYEKRLA